MKPASDDIIENLSLVAPPNYSLWITIGAIAVLGVGAAAAWIWFLYRRKKLPFQKSGEVFGGRSVLAELDALRLLISPEHCREFVFEVSKVLRRYVEWRFGLKAPTLATEEFLWLAESDPALTPDQRFMLGKFLSHCDRVKFALAGMEVSAMEALLDSAVQFVKETQVAEAISNSPV